MDLALEAVDINKVFGQEVILRSISFTVAKHGFVSILGESGTGKTTLLRIIAGTVTPDSGSIKIFGRDCNNIPPHERPIGVVPQSYALFPHLRVRDNLKYPLDQVAGVNPKEKNQLIVEYLDFLDLSSLADKKPAQLSGGQKQRVAVGRGLLRVVALEKLNMSALLLLDEPLSSVDRRLRKELQNYLKSFREKHDVTIIYVTHDQAEASLLSDRIIFLKNGKILQQSSATELFEQPNSLTVAESLGLTSILRGRVRLPRATPDRIELTNGDIIRCDLPQGVNTSAPIHVFVHPRHLRLFKEGVVSDNEGWNHIRVTATSVVYQGLYVEIKVKTNSGEEFGVYLGDDYLVQWRSLPFDAILGWPIDKSRFLRSDLD